MKTRPFFLKQQKTFIYADLLERPNKLVLHRATKEGGLGLVCISSRAKAALITTFLQTAINPNFIRNSYHNHLYRHLVLQEQPTPLISPPYFSGEFYETIRSLKNTPVNIELISSKGVYDFIIASTLRAETEIPGTQGSLNPADWPLIALACEEKTLETDWPKTWRLARQKGLGPDLTSHILKVLWRIIPTHSRLHRFQPRLYPSPTCTLCNRAQDPVEETLEHALGDCGANLGIPERLLQVLQLHQPGATPATVMTLDLVLETSLELPMTWLIGTVLQSLSSQREEGRVTLARTRADVESRCRIGLEASTAGALKNAFTLANILTRDLFQGI